MYLEIRMSIYFGVFNPSEYLFPMPGDLIRPIDRSTSGTPPENGRKTAKKRRPGIEPRPPKKILKGFPVSRYYLRRTIFFMFS